MVGVEMKKYIRERINKAKGYIEDGGVLVALPAVEEKPPTPTFIIEESFLEERVNEVLDRLPKHKGWFSPQEVAFAMSRSDRWVRERFKKNRRCFDAGNRTQVYLSIPRTEVAAEVRRMFRSPLLNAS
jgi:hypothetical protein